MVRIGGMRKLVMDLLDLTRLESGKKKRVLEKVDLRKAAALAAEAVAERAAARGIKVELKLQPQALLNADAGEMEMILSNLLTNAVKYNKQDGRVTLEISNPTSDSALIRCSDTGIGMTAEEQAKLFGEFVRIKNEHTRAIDGSGLGLSILKKIAGLYGGNVKVSSTYGEGSVFEVTLKEPPAAV